MWDFTFDGFLAFILTTIIIVGSIAIFLVAPYFEAKNFNDCTGGHATYWTAFFTELRVQDCSK